MDTFVYWWWRPHALGRPMVRYSRQLWRLPPAHQWHLKRLFHFLTVDEKVLNDGRVDDVLLLKPRRNRLF